jgi:hypothetical protein
MKKIFLVAMLAGLAGGLAEMAWVAFYSTATSTSTAEVARQVTATVISSAAAEPWAPLAGVGIHLALSLALGLAFALALWSLFANRPTAGNIWLFALLTVTAVWAANFLVILPALDSGLARLMPLGATLLSKTLFGVAMAATLQRTAARAPKR